LKTISYKFKVTVNNHFITEVLIGRHYLEKHSSYMNDEVILQLAADIELGDSRKMYRIIWLFEGEKMEILGVVNAYRRKRSKQ
jgi:hypothetical protein